MSQARNQEGPNDPNYYQCPKCELFTGNDWSQCRGACPVDGSPDFNVAAVEKYGPLVKMTEAEMHEVQEAEWRQEVLEGADEEDVPF